MADLRDTARQWLAERYDAARRACTLADCIDWCEGCAVPCREHLADAILAGVEVTTILRPIDDSRRVALLLPAGEGKTA